MRRAEVTAAGRESVHRRRCVVRVQQVKEEQRGRWSTGDGRRAAMRGASSGGGTAIMRDVVGGGGERWVTECVSIGLVGRRQA